MRRRGLFAARTVSPEDRADANLRTDEVAGDTGAGLLPTPPSRPSGRRPRWTGAVLGLLVLGLYLVILTRNDIDARMGSGALPGVPGGWKSLAAGLVLLLIAVATAGYRDRLWRLEQVRDWALTHKAGLAVGGIVLCALILRVYGISDNLPYINQPDEPAVADKALRILQTGDFNVHYFVYPNLYYYMQAAVYVVRFFALVSSGQIETLGQIVPTDFYLWGRLLTALLGTLTVLLVYLTGKRLYGTAIGLVAAVFMATNSVHLLHSQFITTDAPATFFGALAMLAIARLFPDPSGERAHAAPPALPAYVLAGIASGLAIGTKYNSALVILPLLAAHGYAAAQTRPPGDRLRYFAGGRLWAALGATGLAFLATTPFALFDLSHFLNDVASVLSHYRYGHAGHEGDTNWLFYVSLFLRTDTLPTLFTLIGIVFAFARRRPADVLILLFPLALYFSMSNYRVNFDRNLLPLLPFTSILAALPLVEGWRALAAWLSRQRPERWAARAYPAASALLAVIVLVAIWPATFAAAQRDYRQTQPDNRLRAARWLDQNTPPGTKVWLENPSPYLTAGRYLEGHGDHVTDHPLDWYVTNRFEYVVLTATAYKDVVYDHPEKDPPLRDAYLSFFKDNASRLVADFETNKTDQPGPSIRVYRTGYTPPKSVADIHPQHPVNATFRERDLNGGELQLVGADYPVEVKAGQSLPLVLYWSTTRPVGTDYTEFIHLMDSAGKRRAQRDTGPRNGTSPTSQWRAGEVVVDEAGLDLPADLPPGQYMVRVGLYVQQNGQALPGPVVSGGPSGSTPDFVLLGPVDVK